MPRGKSAAQTSMVGREVELSALNQAYARIAESVPRVFLLDGEAGIGKSTVVRSFVAGLRDARVVWVEGLETEADLEYGVIDSLLRTVGAPADVLGRPYNHIEVGLTILELFGDLQSERPVVLVVDDSQWADGASIRVLLFALRRLQAEQVLAIFVARDDEASALPDSVRRLAETRGAAVRLGALTEEQLGVLARQYGLQLPSAVLSELREQTGGSPLYARALFEELPGERWFEPDLRLPAPHRLAAVVRRRMDRLSPAARGLVQAVAVLAPYCTLDRAGALSKANDPATALDEAAEARLLEVQLFDGVTVIAFAHPLYRAAAYEELSPADRSRLHSRAAEIADEPSQALRHRASAALSPDPTLAAQMAELADERAAGGADALAASLLWQASGLLANRADRETYRLRAVDSLLRAGRHSRAGALAHDIGTYAPTALRSYVEGHLALLSREPAHAAPLFERAWRLSDDPGFKAAVARLNTLQWVLQLNSRKVLEWSGRAAVPLPPTSPTAALAIAPRAMHLAQCNRMPEAFALFDSLEGEARVAAGAFSGWLHLIEEDLDRARAELAAAVPAARRLRLLNFSAVALTILTRAEYAVGRWDQALASGDRAVALAEDLENRMVPFVWCYPVAVAASRGDWERADRYAAAATRHAADCLDRAVNLAYLRGLLATERGEPQEVVAALSPLTETTAPGVHEPGFWSWQDLYANALVDTQRLDDAAAVLDTHEPRAIERDRPSMIAKLARARGRLSAARGDQDAAAEVFEAALAAGRRVAMPYELALTELAYGEFLRRANQRRAAAAQLILARDTFELLGARPALERCERELRACGLRPASRKNPDPARLTPSELAVARLVSQGLANREIAADLMLSVRTVEFHLSNVYKKLQLRSRGQLAAHMNAADRTL